MKTKGKMTVIKATLKAYNDESEFFSAPLFCERVKAYTGRPFLMDGTILRRLRELRGNGTINYKVIDSESSRYKKYVVEHINKIGDLN